MSRPRTGCKAKQYSDQMMCGTCGLAWDVNDSDPPSCRPTETNPLKPSSAHAPQTVSARDLVCTHGRPGFCVKCRGGSGKQGFDVMRDNLRDELRRDALTRAIQGRPLNSEDTDALRELRDEVCPPR